MPGPLDGVTVLDLTKLAPGPYCTMLLGDLGADVISIFDPKPPSGRRAEQAAGAPDEHEFAWRGTASDGMARNKRSVGLHLKDERARELFYRLAERADVVVEEFRPGVARRLGIDYETLRERNHRLVFCSVTGYGQDGPYALRAAHDLNYIGQAGLLSLVGRDGRPVVPQNLFADYAGGGLMAALGVVSALFARERTGEGQHVDSAMVDGVMSLLVQFVSAWFGAGELPVPGANMFTGTLPQYGVYETADGKWLTVGAMEPWFFANLCRALGREDLIPYAWDARHHDTVREAFAAAFRTRTRDEWFAELGGEDVCVGRMLALDELEHDPQVQAREMITEVVGPGGTRAKHVGVTPKFSATPGSIRRLPAARGEHTDEVLATIGVTADDLAVLRADGVVG